MTEKNYYQEHNLQNIKYLKEVERILPPYVRTYFIGIEQHTAPSTRIEYARNLKSFFQYLVENYPLCMGLELNQITLKTLSEITAEDIELYLDYLKYYVKDGHEYTNNEQAIKRKMSAIRSFYSYFYNHDKIDNNPAIKVSMPKLHDKAIIRLDINEVAELLDSVEAGTNLTKHQKAFHNKTKVRDLALMTLFLGTGIRVSECVGLDIEHLDFDNDRIKITRKGGYETFVYFGNEVREALLDYLEERKKMKPLPDHEHALFLSSQNKRLGVRSIENLVKKYSRTITTVKKITPHKLRSTYGTALYQETDDIYLVAEVLGHKDVNTTKRHYADMDEVRKRKASSAVTLREKKN